MYPDEKHLSNSHVSTAESIYAIRSLRRLVSVIDAPKSSGTFSSLTRLSRAAEQLYEQAIVLETPEMSWQLSFSSQDESPRPDRECDTTSHVLTEFASVGSDEYIEEFIGERVAGRDVSEHVVSASIDVSNQTEGDR
ncbi:hypothetical protein [Halorubrum cibi]|uniref:Uncharacterized protein n=1 Tax=Halorubrum cibi TaxID=413815 RepID=A0A521CVM0_9EURY|nr:hypothetical protein [Halorubrum cibi]SMO63473.1 hypothetical protein SAMN06264867_105133 [Halorubrum cibi]